MTPIMKTVVSMILLLSLTAVTAIAQQKAVSVERISSTNEGNNNNPVPVTKEHRYKSMVTLYIENDDKSRTPSGWSTRVEDGAEKDAPFEFTPGVGLIAGWTEGVLQMTEGERALLHVPAALGYGSSPMGSKGGAFFIPASSDLLFDIEILGKAGTTDEL